MTTETFNFGDLLRRQRMTAGLTQEELAERAGISVRGLSDLERGVNRAPYPDTLERLIAALSLAADAAAALRAAGRRRRGPTAAGAPAARLLPIAPTPLLGREREEAAAVAILRRATTRLVTLTGPGGVGKTRLALQVAGAVAHHSGELSIYREGEAADYRDGVIFVGLAPIEDPGLLATVIAHELGLRDEGRRSAQDLLFQHLADRQMLLVLDNFEHLIGAAPVVAELLAACSGLHILATSRRPLRLRSEQTLEIGPLTVPEESAKITTEDVGRYPSIALFVQRARAVRPDFTLTPHSAPLIAAIVRRLDGLPLAIELAAARTKVLSPAELLAWMDQPLDILSRGPVDMPIRHQTIRQTIGWSHDLLSPEEKRLWRRLAVFVGGWTHEAARVVWGEEETQPVAVVDMLSSLVEASLIATEGVPDSDETRFTMLETVREFGLDQLIQAREAEPTRHRHAEYCIELATRADDNLWRSPDWPKRLEREQGNIRAALAWTIQRDEAELGLRLATAMRRYWIAGGQTREGRDALETMLRRWTNVPPTLRCPAVQAAGFLAIIQNDYAAAAQHMEETLTLARAIGHRMYEAEALTHLGMVRLDQGHPAEAVRLLEESLPLYDTVEDKKGRTVARNTLGIAYIHLGDPAKARAAFEALLEEQRAAGSEIGMAVQLDNLAATALLEGNHQRALEMAEKSVAVFRPTGNKHHLAQMLTTLALALLPAGRHDEAWEVATESAQLAQDLGQQSVTLAALDVHASILASLGRTGTARRLWETIDRLYAEADIAQLPGDRALTEPYRALVSRTDQNNASSFEEPPDLKTVDDLLDWVMAVPIS